METKIFSAKLDHLHEMFDFLKTFCKFHQLSSSVTEQVILAAEEALVNIIHYSYPEKGSNFLSIGCEKAGSSGIKIIIKDKGVPFNPLKSDPPPLSRKEKMAKKSDETLGGYGIHLLKGMVDVIDYKRVENENVLTLIKYF